MSNPALPTSKRLEYLAESLSVLRREVKVQLRRAAELNCSTAVLRQINTASELLENALGSVENFIEIEKERESGQR